MLDEAHLQRESPLRLPGHRSGRERIVAAATELFAQRGFENVVLRDVARAAEVDVDTVIAHVRDKDGLYEAVFARLFAMEARALGDVAAKARETTTSEERLDALHDILDAYLTFLEEHPEMTALSLRRWMDIHAHPDERDTYTPPLFRLVEEVLASVGEPFPRQAVRTIIWATHGHAVTASGDGPEASHERRAFRGFVHRLVERLYGMP